MIIYKQCRSLTINLIIHKTKPLRRSSLEIFGEQHFIYIFKTRQLSMNRENNQQINQQCKLSLSAALKQFDAIIFTISCLLLLLNTGDTREEQCLHISECNTGYPAEPVTAVWIIFQPTVFH